MQTGLGTSKTTQSPSRNTSHRLSPEAGAIATWLLSLEKTHVLGLNRDGTPKHPLYVPKTVIPVKLFEAP